MNPRNDKVVLVPTSPKTTSLLLAKDLGFLKMDGYQRLELICEEISKMLNALINSLKKK